MAGQNNKHWLKVKGVAAELDVKAHLVQFHWCKIAPMVEAIHKGDPAAILRARGIVEDQEDFGEELCTIASILGTHPKHLRKHAKHLAPLRERLLAGDSQAIDYVKALVDVPMTNLVSKLVEDKLEEIKKNDTKAHFQIMSWAVDKIGGIPEAEKALAAVKVMAS